MGVGTTLSATTSEPTESSPAMAARTNIGPDVRESRATYTGPVAPSARRKAPKAAVMPEISSGVRGAPTRPRTPDTLTIRSEGRWTGIDDVLAGGWAGGARKSAENATGASTEYI